MLHGHIQKINGKRVASPTYHSWQMMKNRCCNKRAEDYAYYGGRGIIIDPTWHYFENFLADIGVRPSLKHTLERVNNNLGYSKSNCVWESRQTQARNRPAYNKLTKPLADQIRQLYAMGTYRQVDLAEQFGVTQASISQVTRWAIWR
jgi:hypothetical protein